MVMRKKDKEKEKVWFPSLSRKEAIILEMLVGSGGDLYGLEMVENSGGELKRGTVYVTLQRMEEKGFLESKQEIRLIPEAGIPRRLYSITGLGERVLAAHEAARSVMTADMILAK